MENKVEEKEQKEKNNSQKKWKKILILLVIILSVIIIGLGIWYFFINKVPDTIDILEYNNSMEFKDDKGKKIVLYNNEYNYPMEVKHDNKIEKTLGKNIVGFEKDKLSMIFGEHFWYLLSYNDKKIVASYVNLNCKVSYKESGSNIYEVMVFYEDSDSKNVVLVLNAKTGIIKRFDDKTVKFSINENIRDYVYDNNKDILYLYTDKTAVIVNDKKVVSQKYDSIVQHIPVENEWNFKASGKLFVINNNSKYIVDLYDWLKEAPLDTLVSNNSEEHLLEIYKYNDKLYCNYNYDIFELESYKVYNGNKMEFIIYKDSLGASYGYYHSDKEEYHFRINEEEKNNNNNFPYLVYTIENQGQCYPEIFINKKNNKIEKVGYYYIKNTKNNYYFIKFECGSAPNNYIYTSNDKYLGKGFENILDNDDNVYVHDDNYVYKYDVNGNELFKSKKYEYLNNGIIINNTLYFLAKEDGNLYLINLANDEKAEIIHNYQDNISYNYEISYDNDNITIYEPTESDDIDVYEYNIITKTVTKVH